VKNCLANGFFKWALEATSLSVAKIKEIYSSQEEIKQVQQKLKITKNQVLHVCDMLIYAKIDKEHKECLSSSVDLFKENLMTRFVKNHETDFNPMKNRKIPYISFEGTS